MAPKAVLRVHGTGYWHCRFLTILFGSPAQSIRLLLFTRSFSHLLHGVGVFL
jgi:hypothetical protein